MQQRRLTGSRDTPISCQSSVAIPVNLGCISTTTGVVATLSVLKLDVIVSI
jgi:hypothetical protein